MLVLKVGLQNEWFYDLRIQGALLQPAAKHLLLLFSASHHSKTFIPTHSLADGGLNCVIWH